MPQSVGPARRRCCAVDRRSLCHRCCKPQSQATMATRTINHLAASCRQVRTDRRTEHCHCNCWSPFALPLSLPQELNTVLEQSCITRGKMFARWSMQNQVFVCVWVSEWACVSVWPLCSCHQIHCCWFAPSASNHRGHWLTAVRPSSSTSPMIAFRK